jgi:hypothetical protein
MDYICCKIFNMSKPALFLLLIGLSLSTNAQKYYSNTFTFDMVDTANLSKQEIFKRANEWFALSFKDSKSVISYSDKDAGEIIGKGNLIAPDLHVPIMGNQPSDERVNFTITINVKDGKYKILLSDFYHEGYYLSLGALAKEKPRQKGEMNIKRFAQVKKSAMKDVLVLLLDLKTKMHEKESDF